MAKLGVDRRRHQQGEIAAYAARERAQEDRRGPGAHPPQSPVSRPGIRSRPPVYRYAEEAGGAFRGDQARRARRSKARLPPSASRPSSSCGSSRCEPGNHNSAAASAVHLSPAGRGRPGREALQAQSAQASGLADKRRGSPVAGVEKSKAGALEIATTASYRSRGPCDHDELRPPHPAPSAPTSPQRGEVDPARCMI